MLSEDWKCKVAKERISEWELRDTYVSAARCFVKRIIQPLHAVSALRDEKNQQKYMGDLQQKLIGHQSLQVGPPLIRCTNAQNAG
jgi:hypothetical protein